MAAFIKRKLNKKSFSFIFWIADGLALHIEECNVIRKVTYIENDVMCVIAFDGDNIQLSKK